MFPSSDVDLNKILLALSEVVRDGTTSKLLRSQCLVALYHAFRMWTLMWHKDQRLSTTPFPSLSLTVVSRGLRAEATNGAAKEEARSVAACIRIVHVLITFLRQCNSHDAEASSSFKDTLEAISAAQRELYLFASKR